MAVTEWIGTTGLHELTQVNRVAVPDSSAFYARKRTFLCAGLFAWEWHSTSMVRERTVEAAAGSLELVLVVQGKVRWASQGNTWEGHPGQLHLMAGEETTQWIVVDGVRLRTLQVPEELFPEPTLARGALRSGLLEDTTVSRAFALMFGQVSDSFCNEEIPSSYLTQGVRSLALAVVEERAVLTEAEFGLKIRILRHVDANLADPRLSPRQIAGYFKVSLRWVHYVFNDGGETLGRYIRRRRTDAVAQEVRASPGSARPAALAMSYGFSGRDHLTRCFRSHWGLTIAQFADAVAAGEEPQPLLSGPS